MPGACEAMVHWRSTVKQAACEGLIEPIVMFDLDLVNMFGTAEWPSVREALAAHFDEALPWVQWQHTTAVRTFLPSGAHHDTDRGAEQGDAFGSAQAALALGHYKEETFTAGPLEAAPPRAADEWFIDDGQVAVRPGDADAWLQRFDRALDRFGATRGTRAEGNAKSSCRLLCPTDRQHEFDGWDTEYIHTTCAVLQPEDATSALGAIFGSVGQINQHAHGTLVKVKELRAAVASIDHAPTELVLIRQCADVSKLAYLARVHGDILDRRLLNTFDSDLRAAVEISLGGAIEDTAWWQATAGVKHAGLGFREASSTTLASFVASRVSSRPLAATMFDHVQNAMLGQTATLLRLYDDRTTQAVERLLGSLPPRAARQVTELLERARLAAADTWDVMRTGEDTSVPEGRPTPVSRGPGAGLTPNDGTGDEEHPDATLGRVARLQHSIQSIVDECNLAALTHYHQEAQNVDAVHRLDELSHPTTDHTWLWRINPRHGAILEEEEYVDAVRMRLGTAGPTEVSPCARCGKELMGPSASHAMTCDIGAATRGHNNTTNCLHRYARQVDHSAETEAPDLIRGTDLRPADLLTNAAGQGMVAADVSIVSPDAARAGADCTITRHDDKMAKYAPFFNELARQGITYKPLVWSCFGRPHPEASTFVANVAHRIARRRGHCDHRLVGAQIRSDVTVEIWRRNARQLRGCLPDPGDSEGDGGTWPPPRGPAG